MAKIEYVDYVGLAAKAKEIRSHAEILNKHFTNAYKSVINMHKDWFGERYNDLGRDFNELAPSIDEILKITVTEIPFNLETVANNYSQANTGTNITSAQATHYVKMENVPTPNDTGMRFMTQQVTLAKDGIKAMLKSAVTELDTIESTYNKISWQSEAADVFRTKFRMLKTKIKKEIETINTQFDRLMQETLDQMQITEDNNTDK